MQVPRHRMVSVRVAIIVGVLLMALFVGCTQKQSFEIGKNPTLEEITSVSLTQTAMDMTGSFSFFATAMEDGTHTLTARFHDFETGRFYEVEERAIAEDEWSQLVGALVGCTVEKEEEDTSGIFALDATETSVNVYWPGKPDDGGYWPVVLDDEGKAYSELLATFKALTKKYA